MKILNIEWEAFGLEDIKDAFAAEGYDVSGFPFSKHENAVDNQEMEKRFRSVLCKEVPDVVFSFDYYPVFSKVCQQEHIRYISWVYDNPQILLYSDMVVNPCNVIFVFDKKIYQEFHDSGIKTVHYMPLAVNTERLDHMTLDAQSCKYDISFVGSLYLEELSYFERMSIRLSDYAKGYLDSLMAAQMRIQGYNFIEESLGSVIEELYRVLPIHFGHENRATREYFYAHYVIDRKITSDERIELLSAIARQHRVDLFTLSKEFQLPNVYNHGAVDPYTGAPFVYKQSRINLNITLRSIERGIPLRAFDIMGAGGFLISNFQADFLDYFVPGEDFIYYEDKEDLLKKIDYYLDHEQERKIIAKNGHDKVAAGHTFRHRVREMFAQV
ncbi:MAG: glycosyltransferase [Lachnospiraceae bacterium]|nr:glycosyltransferase [Lachnospiraceae bacterium]